MNLQSQENLVTPGQSVATRFATVDDANALVEIGRRTFHETFAVVNTEEDMRLYLDKTFTPERLQGEIEDPACRFMLAVDGDIIAGYAKLKEQKNTPELNGKDGIELERLYVRKEYLGKKVGHLLMKQCLDIAVTKGYSVIWLGVWEHNTRALAFYEKWGFEIFGSHPFVLGTDMQTDLIMKKTLN